MSEHKYTRRGKRITQHWHVIDDNERAFKDVHTYYDSINQAKRKSRALQMKHDGALGLGVVHRWTRFELTGCK